MCWPISSITSSRRGGGSRPGSTRKALLSKDVALLLREPTTPRTMATEDTGCWVLGAEPPLLVGCLLPHHPGAGHDMPHQRAQPPAGSVCHPRGPPLPAEYGRSVAQQLTCSHSNLLAHA
jgi:hypothetical protein